MKNKVALLLVTLMFLASCGSNNLGYENGSNLENIQPEEVVEYETSEENPDMMVQNGDEVEVHYLGTLENGEQFDSSYDRGQTLPFQVGAGGMIAGFDSGVLGMKAGEKKTLTLAPSEAYGEWDEKRTVVQTKTELKEFEDAGIVLEEGAELITMYGKFKILKVEGEDVTIDMNHQLAGKTLVFEVEMVKIKRQK